MKSRKRKPMLASKKTKRGVIGAVVLAGLPAVSGYALSKPRTVAASVAGHGQGTVSGINVTKTTYTLGATDKSNVVSFALTLASAPATGAKVWASPVAATSGYIDCGTGDGTTTVFTCTAAGSTTVDSIATIDVVVADA